MRRFLLLVFILLHIANARRLNWAALDSLPDSIKNLPKFGYGGNLVFEDIDSNPNSTTSIGNRIVSTYYDEEGVWDGTTAGAPNLVPTYAYLKAMSNVTSAVANFIRTTYGTIYADLPLQVCNSITTPVEIILDSNLGFGPNKISLNSTDLSKLIPPHNCVLPRTDTLPNGPTFDDIRKYMPDYKTYLEELDQFLECVLVFNAYPAYTKGVNCLEGYYYGVQDAGANPAFFDLMAHKRDLSNTIANFVADPEPADVTLIDPQTWTEFQYALDIARQYKAVARKVRATAMLIYNAITKNYARLERVKYCKQQENEMYAQNLNVSSSWCQFQDCFELSCEFSLVGVTFGVDSPLQPQNASICDESICSLSDEYPEPFYCDTTRNCPFGWFCSLLDRHCYKEQMRNDFVRQTNTTICGYPRRLADASVLSGTTTNAFGGTVEESAYWFNTFWPQDCISTTILTEDTTKHADVGPIEIAEICYPFNVGEDASFFYQAGVTNCSMLAETTHCFTDVTYLYYVDGEATAYKNETFCVTRLSTTSESWQVHHCRSDGTEPIVFGDYDGSADYLKCDTGTPDCITRNSTIVCYHNVQDVLRVFDHFLSAIDTVCSDIRIYGDMSNVTQNYTDPNASLFPPASQAVPSGYTNSTYFTLSPAEYNALSGTFASSGTVPPSMTPPQHAIFLGYYSEESANNYKLSGRLTFYDGSDVETGHAEGADYFLTTNSPVVLEYLPTLSVDNSTGELLYDPLTDNHPNPRFNDASECFFLQISSSANLLMVDSPEPAQVHFKDYWMAGVTQPSEPVNVAPVLQPCAAIFLRKILYVQNNAWIESTSTDYEAGVQSGVLRYVCERSLEMSATCSRLGMPMTSADLTDILTSVNPPSDTIVFQL